MIDETSSWDTVRVNPNALCCYARYPENPTIPDSLNVSGAESADSLFANALQSWRHHFVILSGDMPSRS